MTGAEVRKAVLEKIATEIDGIDEVEAEDKADEFVYHLAKNSLVSELKNIANPSQDNVLIITGQDELFNALHEALLVVAFSMLDDMSEHLVKKLSPIAQLAFLAQVTNISDDMYNLRRMK